MPKEGTYFITEKGYGILEKLYIEIAVVDSEIAESEHGSERVEMLKREQNGLVLRRFILNEARSGGYNIPEGSLEEHFRPVLKSFVDRGFLEFVSSKDSMR